MLQTGLPWTAPIPEWWSHLHVLTRLCLAVFAANLINIPVRWYLYECTADSLHILRTGVSCPKLSFCSIPWLVVREIYVSLSYFMHMWQQPCVLYLQKCGVVDFTRRRRWLRRCRQDLTRPSSPPQETLPRKPLPNKTESTALPRQVTGLRQLAVIWLTVGLVWCRAIAAENSKKEMQRTLLGIV